jgi:two-component system chemotaxis sensor kinase CheA
MDVNEQEERDEDIRQFLIESNENLATLDDEIVKLEKTPENNALISSVFRTIHTIKGTCGFFGFDLLSATAHITENILAQARAGQRTLTPDVISLILEAVDKIKILLVNIEQTGVEGDVDCAELIGRLEKCHDACGSETAHAAPPPVPPPPAPVVAPVAVASAPAPVVVAPPPAPATVAAPPPPPVQAAPPPPPAAPVAAAPAPTPAPPPAPAAPAAPAKAPAASTDSTIRVDVGLLDKLMNLVGELVLARNQLLQNSSTQSSSLQKTTQRLNLITSELQEGVMKTRMQPIGVVWNKLPRVVRDLASQVGKQISIEMIGADTELDKTIIEAIKDPLTHIVRNSCDHGVENPATRTGKGKDPEGRLLLRAFHEGGVVNIEITDDGAGIDPNKMRTKAIEKGLITEEQAAQMNDQSARELIFAPGFSTAEKVTSISGRGVGMDVVKTNIEKIGGNVEILEGKPYGTTIRIRIPLTLAIIPGLIVSLTPKPAAQHGSIARDERFVVPQANLLELVRVEGPKIEERIKSLHGTPIFHYRGQLLPLVYLRRILGKSMPEGDPEAVSIVVLQAENRSLGLVVDAIHDTQEIVVKPLGRQLKGLDCYLGGTIMGDGLPALILDVAGLARLANLQGRNSSATVDSSRSGPQQAALPTKMLLLFRAGNFHRIAVPLPLVARLEKIPTNTVERAAGHAVLHYRGDILPLVDLASVLEPGSGHDAFAEEIIQLIVFTDGARRIGVIVDQIVDIVDEAVTVRRGAAAPGLLGSAVIGGKITDLLDLHAVVSAGGGNWLNSDDIGSQGHTILLLDSCLPAREMIAEYLGASGFDVTSANSVGDAMPRIRQSRFDIVIAAVPEGRSGFDTLKALRRDKQFDRTPILGLVDHPEQLDAYVPDGLSYDARIMRSNRDELIASISALVRPSGHYHQAMFEEAA